MKVEELSFILMGIIIMIILYTFFGKYIEHKHVSSAQFRFTFCMRQVLAF